MQAKKYEYCLQFLISPFRAEAPCASQLPVALHSIRDKFSDILALMPNGLLLLLLPTISEKEVTTWLGCSGCFFLAQRFLTQLGYSHNLHLCLSC